MGKDHIKLTLFHLLNCLNCGELCLFLFVESGERTVHLLYVLLYLFYSCGFCFPVFYNKYLANMYHKTSLYHHVVQHEVIHVPPRKLTLKKKKKKFLN